MYLNSFELATMNMFQPEYDEAELERIKQRQYQITYPFSILIFSNS